VANIVNEDRLKRQLLHVNLLKFF